MVVKDGLVEGRRSLPDYLGVWGRYQSRLLMLSLFTSIMMATQILAFSFSAAQPKTRCKVLDIDNEPGSNYATAFLAPNAHKYFVDEIKDEFCKYCPNATLGHCTDANAIYCDHGYVYDFSEMSSSLAIKFDMACAGAWKRAFISSMFMSGFLVGSFFTGVLSDRFGRRPVVLTSAIIQVFTLNLYPVVPTYETLCALVFFNGGIQYAAYMPTFTVVMEVTNELARTICGASLSLLFAVGFIYVGWAGYLVRDWRWLHFACSIPAILYATFFWLMPESIRWLLVNDRDEEAKTEFKIALQCNSIKMQPQDLDKAMSNCKGFTIAGAEHSRHANFLDLFRHWILAKMTIIMMFAWTTVSLVYFGIGLNLDGLGADKYLTFILSGLTEMPGYLVIILVFHYFGRKPGMVLAFSLSGTCCIVKELVPASQTSIITTLALAGKNAAGSAFAGVYIYSAELFPTVVRNSSIGMGSLFARIGAIIAPQLFFWSQQIAPILPYIICGSLSLTVAGCMLLLPETKNRDMPATIDEGLKSNQGHGKLEEASPMICAAENGHA